VIWLQTWLLTWLTILLISHFRIGYLWINRMVLTFLYAGLLSPALLQLLWYYVSSGKVLRGIQYGKEPRNFLDVYLPDSEVITLHGCNVQCVHHLGCALKHDSTFAAAKAETSSPSINHP
jgi:hypothetical protein